jgi:serine/threonine-protein kinase
VNEPKTDKIARYELLSKVGQGANGIVYRAQDPTIRRVVALKVLPAEPIQSSTSEGSRTGSTASFFEREAQAAGALLHPHIVTLYDAGRDGDWYYLAMEFVEGGTFAAEIARGGRVPIERAVDVVAVVADALDFAHEHGVIHRDIKPANLMILPDQTVKVADFGIARLASAAATMTTDMMVGTPYYMSPEQVRGGKLDGRSDLFSLGVVLYEAITGRKPFQADSLAAILNKILTVTPEAPHEVEGSVPAELSRVVMKAVARDADDRYARGKEMAAELRRFRGSHRRAGDATLALAPAAAAPRSRARAGLLAGGVVVLAATAGALVLKPRPPAPAVSGYMKTVSEPSGADVLVAGKVVGRTPYVFELPAGKYEIEFQKDGYYPNPLSVTVEANKTVVVDAPMTAIIKEERP